MCDPQTVQMLYNKSVDLMCYLHRRSGRLRPGALEYYAHTYWGDGKLRHYSGKNIPFLLRWGSAAERQWVRFYGLKDVELTCRLYEVAGVAAHKRAFVAWQLQQISGKITSMTQRKDEGGIAAEIPESWGTGRPPPFGRQVNVVTALEACDEACETLFGEVKASIETYREDVQRYLCHQMHQRADARTLGDMVGD